jgi:ADP-ribose pyrophosphatase
MDPEMAATDQPERLAREVIYESRWVNLYADRVQFPNGRVIERHHLLDFERPSVVMVARDDGGRYLMVKVCRYPTGRSEWEFPAGRVEAGESAMEAAERELYEETGCRARDVEEMYAYHTLSGISNQVSVIVRCQVGAPEAGFDGQEIAAVGWFTPDALWAMIQAREMWDGLTLVAFLLAERRFHTREKGTAE